MCGFIFVFHFLFFFPLDQTNQFFFSVYAFDSDNTALYSVVHLSQKSPAYDLLSKMLE